MTTPNQQKQPRKKRKTGIQLNRQHWGPYWKWTESRAGFFSLMLLAVLGVGMAAAALAIASVGAASDIVRVLDCRKGVCTLTNGTALVIDTPNSDQQAEFQNVQDGALGAALRMRVRSKATGGDQTDFLFRADGTIAIKDANGSLNYTLARDCLGQAGNATCSSY